MKDVTFIKRHISGIPEGTKKTLHNDHADRLAKEGYVEIDGEEKPDPVEPEFLEHKLTKKDIKEGVVGLIQLTPEHKVGDVIEVPNPAFKQFQ